MGRYFWLLFALLAGRSAIAQAADSSMAITFTGAINLPLAMKPMHALAMEAWKVSFGREPGAAIVLNDADKGVLEATAHFNYRSAKLNGREETMGRVSYRVRIRSENGTCSVGVTQFKHQGNKAALRGGIDLGLVTVSGPPLGRTPGLSPWGAKNILAEVRARSRSTADRVIRAFVAAMQATASDR
ncbi:MAG: hypothetical protein IPI07_08820 [Flavobacteriales bacterium]|nr:hypothetical protein [Flavobacteriales bacterium]